MHVNVMRIREMMGYKSIKSKEFVPVDEAFDYAKEHLNELNEKDRKEFVEWFFSGNWYRED